ncbi:MAG TPA: hypothetical protein VFH85_07705 [Gammaproteobacteria bacterium]|nr:hypothetical protein [Gammaproteobacteria bacterium]
MPFTVFSLEIDFSTPVTEPCAELGRVTRAYVSAYDRGRIHVARVRRQEKRCVVADFNGAIPVGRTVVSATWRATNPWVTLMSDASIAGRAAQVTVDFQFAGCAALKATVTLDNGEIYNQVFEFTVRDCPWFFENDALTTGPYVLTVTA